MRVIYDLITVSATETASDSFCVQETQDVLSRVRGEAALGKQKRGNRNKLLILFSVGGNRHLLCEDLGKEKERERDRNRDHGSRAGAYFNILIT